MDGGDRERRAGAASRDQRDVFEGLGTAGERDPQEAAKGVATDDRQQFTGGLQTLVLQIRSDGIGGSTSHFEIFSGGDCCLESGALTAFSWCTRRDRCGERHTNGNAFPLNRRRERAKIHTLSSTNDGIVLRVGHRFKGKIVDKTEGARSWAAQ